MVATQLANTGPEPADIFIAYRRRLGTHFAERVYRLLQDGGFRVYMDVHGYSPGSFPKRLEEKIRSSQVVLVVLSPYCFADKPSDGGDDWLVRETTIAHDSGRHVVVLRDESFDYRDLPDALAFLRDLEDVQYVSAYPRAYEEKLLTMIHATGLSAAGAEEDAVGRARPGATPAAYLGGGTRPDAVRLEKLHDELLRLRNSATLASEQFGGPILASAGLCLPFKCRAFLMRLRKALTTGGVPAESLPAFPAGAFRISTALVAIGTLALLYATAVLTDVWPWPNPHWIASLSVRALLAPPAIVCMLGMLGLIQWLWRDLAELHPIVTQYARQANLEDVDLRRDTMQWYHGRSLAACVVAHVATMFVFVLLMNELIKAFQSPDATIWRPLIYMATIVVQFLSFDVLIVGVVKDAFVDTLWPRDNTLTLKGDFFARPPRRSPAHWCNLHFQVWAMTLVMLIFVATGIFKIVDMLSCAFPPP